MASYKLRVAQFSRWPKYKEQYLKTFKNMLEERQRRNLTNGSWGQGTEPEDVMRWWLEDPNLDGQISVFDEGE